MFQLLKKRNLYVRCMLFCICSTLLNFVYSLIFILNALQNKKFIAMLLGVLTIVVNRLCGYMI